MWRFKLGCLFIIISSIFYASKFISVAIIVSSYDSPHTKALFSQTLNNLPQIDILTILCFVLGLIFIFWYMFHLKLHENK